MRRLLLSRYARKPTVQEVSLPEGDLLVKMAYAPVNPSDYHYSLGVYGMTRVALPSGLGFEGVGTVVRGAHSLLGRQVGVFLQPQGGQFPQGTYSDYVAVTRDQLVLLPPGDD